MDESCNNLMLDDQSIDEDSLTDDMYQILLYYISSAYIDIAVTSEHYVVAALIIDPV